MPFEGGDFESWLEHGLDRALGSRPAPSPLATQASYHAAYLSGGVGMSSFSSTLVAALTSKAALAGATAAVIVGGGTAVAATSASGSANPSNWGQFISQTVVPDCKAQAASAGLHGIGACVSSIARTHGASEARLHAASEAKLHGKASQARGHEEASEGRKNGAENGKPNGNQGQGASDHGQGPNGVDAGGSGSGNSSNHGASGKH